MIAVQMNKLTLEISHQYQALPALATYTNSQKFMSIFYQDTLYVPLYSQDQQVLMVTPVDSPLSTYEMNITSQELVFEIEQDTS